MKKYFSLGLLLLTAGILSAYDPGRDDFGSEYQFALYRSWLNHCEVPSDTPAGFRPDVITRIFTSGKGEEIDIEYDWQDHKIFNQRESLNKRAGTGISLENLYLLESLVYRLNTTDSLFIADFLEITGIKLYTGDSIIEDPREFLDRVIPGRISIISIRESGSVPSEFLLITKALTITVRFPEQMISLKEIFLREPALEIPIHVESGMIPPEIFTGLPLPDYITSRLNDPPLRELLHNKISNPEDFLRREFPDHALKMTDRKAYLTGGSFEGFASSNLALTYNSDADGIDFYPDSSFRIEGNYIYLNDGESFYLPAIEDHELEAIAPYLSQLIYGHRSIGSRLLNFLLIHDDVPTTLVIRAQERRVFEIDSYADLLLILNDKWQDDHVYFSLSDFRKVNNYIEFKGFLIAEKKGGKSPDTAEIWFHLNSDHRIDLIMMILFPANIEEDRP